RRRDGTPTLRLAQSGLCGGSIMTQQATENRSQPIGSPEADARERARCELLRTLGRFATVTAPTVGLLLSVASPTVDGMGVCLAAIKGANSRIGALQTAVEGLPQPGGPTV